MSCLIPLLATLVLTDASAPYFTGSTNQFNECSFTLRKKKSIPRHTIVIWIFHLSIIEQFELVIEEQLDILLVVQKQALSKPPLYSVISRMSKPIFVLRLYKNASLTVVLTTADFRCLHFSVYIQFCQPWCLVLHALGF
jgi:hypothetical protein